MPSTGRERLAPGDEVFDDAPDDLEDLDDDLDFWQAALPDVDEDELDKFLAFAGELAGTVAAVALLDLFSDAWESLEATQGEDPADMVEAADEKLDNLWGQDGSMWDTIIDTNVQDEFNDAKDEGDQAEGWEYSMYVAEDGACEICSPLHGTILPIDDPWWAMYEPPNHCNCRCAKVPMSYEEAMGQGGVTGKPEEGVEPQPGFGLDRGVLWIPDLSTRPPELAHEFQRRSTAVVEDAAVHASGFVAETGGSDHHTDLSEGSRHLRF